MTGDRELIEQLGAWWRGAMFALGLGPAPVHTDLASEAKSAVEADPSRFFSSVSPDAPTEDAPKPELYRHVIAHTQEYFVCACCGDGPWHQSWTERHHRLGAHGPCCTGAD